MSTFPSVLGGDRVSRGPHNRCRHLKCDGAYLAAERAACPYTDAHTSQETQNTHLSSPQKISRGPLLPVASVRDASARLRCAPVCVFVMGGNRGEPADMIFLSSEPNVLRFGTGASQHQEQWHLVTKCFD